MRIILFCKIPKKRQRCRQFTHSESQSAAGICCNTFLYFQAVGEVPVIFWQHFVKSCMK